MTEFRLHLDDVVAVGGDVLRFIGRTKDHLRIPQWQDMRTEKVRQIRDDELAKLLEADDGARMLSPEDAKVALETGAPPVGIGIIHLEDIASPWERRRVERLARYCEAWREAGRPPLSDTNLLPIIDAVGGELGELVKLSPRSIRRFARAWDKGGLAALVSEAKNRGRKTTLSAEALGVVEDRIWDTYLTQRAPSVKMTLEAVHRIINDKNERRVNGDPQIPLPSKKQLQARIDKIDAFTKLCLREGEAAALKKYGPRYAGVVTARPNQRWELDATVLDVFAVHPQTGEVIGRPTLVVAIDCHTRMIMGWYIGFAYESFVTAMVALRAGILSNGALKQRFPGLVHEHPAFGMPEAVAVDNHLAYSGEGFKRACTAAGIKVLYTPVLKAWWRPIVERFFGTATRRVFQRMPGSVASNVLKRNKETPPETVAVATLAQIEEAFARFAVDEYAYEVHRGLKTAPAHAWKREVGIHGVIPPKDKQTLDAALAIIEERTLQHYGIEWETMVFNSPAVAAARIAPGAPAKHRISVNPRDLSSVMLFVPSEGRWVRVPLVKPVPAEGTILTFDAWCLSRELLKDDAQRFLDENDKDGAFRRVHAHVLQMFAEPPSGASIKARRRGARWAAWDKRPRAADPDTYDEAASAAPPSDDLFAGMGAAAPGAGSPGSGGDADDGASPAEGGGAYPDGDVPPPPGPDPAPRRGRSGGSRGRKRPATPAEQEADRAEPVTNGPLAPEAPAAVFFREDGSFDLDEAAKALGMDSEDY
ncbi:DDE-type integrase/transposase/recombinase [Pseudoroseomonas ludipueritiae]|uniref:Transposase family protein n=1 Tax=Pseudoroseomonas ludipueritiae TaxID=198093 RepID=A0ABR7R7P8_9PROT|nr:transposase family protein [Pseudoroseomonas ludipueritiae]